MHFSLIVALALIQNSGFEFDHAKFQSTIVAEAPAQPSTKDFDNWYKSVTEQYHLCKHLNYAHPICPGINPAAQAEYQIQEPTGPLSSQALLAASGLYVRGQAPTAWLTTLNLAGRKPSEIDARLWAEAQYLYAQVLFDQKKFKESSILLDRAVDRLKGKALFHQERAWTLFFAGELDRSLGSLFSAMSPLLHPTPYFEKYFLRALIEREACLWDKAFATISAGRVDLQNSFYDATQQPFVKLCEKDQLGQRCADLRKYFEAYGAEQIKNALTDLDLLEMEMQDRGVTKQKKLATSRVIWPFLGEAWQDEIGFYRVKLESQC